MPVMEIIEGMMSSLIYDGLKRPTKGIADAVSRRKSISKALISEPQTDETRRKDSIAVDDLIKTIAHAFGKYDTQIASFLSAINRSTIPDALRQFIICGRDIEQIYPGFQLIYESHAPLGFECRNFFDALVAAVKQRLMQGVSDKGTFEVVAAQHKELIARLDALGSTLQSASKLGEAIAADRFADARIRVCRSIESANKHIPVETTNGMKRVPIAKMVIGARLSPLDVRNKALIAHREVLDPSETTISFMGFRRSFNRAVIMGDPGGGKSTLTQFLCFTFASQILLEDTNKFNPKFNSSDLKIPLRVIVRSLERKQQKSPSYSIFDHILDEHRVSLDSNSSFTAQFLSQLLAIGGAVVLFDGLDEILDVELRRGMTLQIEQFSNVYASCPILVTSRIVGYLDAPMSEDFAPYTLARFDKQEIKKFSEQLLKNVLNLKKDEAALKSAEFLAQTERLASDLRQNPLLLGLMVYIFAIKGSIPNNRPEIYKECSVLMFEKWDQRRNIIVELPPDIELLDLFSFIAKQIFGNAETEDGVSEDWLLHQLREYFFSWYGTKPKSIEMSKKFVEFVTGRAWVMCDVGPKLFKFTHRTFLEYFFARRLQEESRSVEELISTRLLEKIYTAQWDVVGHLALQISVFRSTPRSEQACDTLLSILNSSQMQASQQVNFLIFFAKAIEYLSIPETRCLSIARTMFQRAIELGTNHDLGAIGVVHQLLAKSQSRKEAVLKEVKSLAQPILNGPSCGQRSFLLYLAGTEWSGDVTIQYPIDQSEGQIIYRGFKDVRRNVQGDQSSRSKSDVNESRTLVLLNGAMFMGQFSRHGARLLLATTSETVPFELRMLPYLALAEAARLFGARPYFIRSYFANKTVAGKFVDEFSDLVMSGEADDLIKAQHVNLPHRLSDQINEDLITTMLYLIAQKSIKGDAFEVGTRVLYCLIKFDQAASINVDQYNKNGISRQRAVTYRNFKNRSGEFDLESKLRDTVFGSAVLKWFLAQEARGVT